MITLNSAKDYLALTTTANDSFLNTLISYASTQIETICQAPIIATDVTYYFDGLGAEFKYLPFIQVNALNTVSERDYPNESWAVETCYLTEKNNVYYAWNENTFDSKQYKAELNVGFSTIPNDIKLICTEIVATLYNESNKGDGRLGIETHDTQGLNGLTQNTTFKSLTNEWRNRLKKYTVPTC